MIAVVRLLMCLALVGCGRFGFAADANQADVDVEVVVDSPASEPGLVVWYRMDDDPADGSLEDSAGGDHRALCAAGLSCGTAATGVRGGAVAFQGQQFYRLPFEAQLDTPTSFTVAAWVRPEAATPAMLVTKRYDLIYNSWGLRLTDLNEVRFESARAGPTGESLTTTQTLAVGVWTHLAISWDDTDKKIYINGVRFTETGAVDIAFDSGELLIGCDEDSGTRLSFLVGALDDVRIYNRVLGESEIGLLAQP